jgi:hypothetical protein
MHKLTPYLGVLLVFAALTAAARADLTGIDGKPLRIAESAQEKLELARDALRQGDFAESRRLTERVVSQTGDLPHPDVLIAFWLVEAGQFGSAQQLLEQLSRTQTSRPDIHYAFAEFARAQGRPFDAWTHLMVAETASPPPTWTPKYSEEFLNSIVSKQALVAELREDWPTLKRLANRLQAAGVSGGQLELWLGRATFQMGDAAQAEVHFRQAARIAPAEVCPELLMANLYDGQGKPRETEVWFKKGIEESREHKEKIRLEFALWLLRQQRPEAAQKLVRPIEPGSPLADQHALVAAIGDYMLGKYDKAAAEMSRLAEQDPNNIVLANLWALALVELSDETQQAKALEIALANLEKSPASPNFAASVAWIKHRLGQQEAAEQIAAAIAQRGGQLSRDSAFFLGHVIEKSQAEGTEKLWELARTSQGEFLNQRRLEALKKKPQQ